MSPFVPTEFDTDVNVSKVHPLAEVVRFGGGLIVILLATYILLAGVINFALPHIPVEWENKFWGGFVSEPKTKQDAVFQKKQAYLQRLVDDLPKDSKIQGYNFKVHVIKDENINAFAVPGGHILMTTGLLDKAKSENGLIFILGHELGHFQNRDHLRGIGLGFAASLISFLLTGDRTASRSLIDGVGALTSGVFSRHQESDADLWGLKALYGHYGHVGGAIEFFEILEAEEKSRLNIEVLSTHPLTPNRIAKLREVIAQNGWKENPLKALPWGQKSEAK